MKRLPIAAGKFYEADSKKLKERIKECFLSNLGPGSLPEKKSEKHFSAIAPHAGYVYSGAAAAHVYKKIGEIEGISTFVIIGTNHTGLGTPVSIFPEGKWKTPLGEAKIDAELAGEIAKNSKFAQFDIESHLYEHSIEVQLPFLQFLFEKIKIVPIVFRRDKLPEEAEDLADAIEISAKKLKRKIFVIASSDFTHYGDAYDFLPFSGSNEEIKKRVYELDKKAISQIINLDEKKFLKYVYENKLTICGFAPITAAIFYAKKHVKKGKLLKYYCSGDVSGNYKNCVGYASILF